MLIKFFEFKDSELYKIDNEDSWKHSYQDIKDNEIEIIKKLFSGYSCKHRNGEYNTKSIILSKVGGNIDNVIVIAKMVDDYFRISHWYVHGNLNTFICDQIDGLCKYIKDKVKTS